MKPNFALNLSNDGVELLHRGTSGWRSLGAVKFENDDVQAGCARLVAEAEKLEPGNVRTKLILPESQLRYSTVLAPGPTDEARRFCAVINGPWASRSPDCPQKTVSS